MKWMWRSIGVGLILAALLTLHEAVQLLQHNVGYGFGPATFPMILGVCLALLGADLAATAGREADRRVVWPRWDVARGMLAAMGTLGFYAGTLPVLGYGSSTLVAAILLFRTAGGYGWKVSLIAGAVTAGLLYLMFNLLVQVPFPTGLLV